MAKRKNEPETLFNKVFLELKNMFNISIPDFCKWAGTELFKFDSQTTDESVYAKIGHYTTFSRPNATEKDLFIEKFVEYLTSRCKISDSDILEHRADFENILQGVNIASHARGMDVLVFYADIKFIEKLLSRAYTLSDPAPKVSGYPKQHFDNNKINGSPYFIGRDNFINAVLEKIVSGQSVYLHGIGGIGKTEIVKAIVKNISNELIDNSKNPITDIIWIDLNDGKDEENLRYGEDIKRKIYLSLNPKADIGRIDWDKEYKSCLDIIKSMGDRLLIVIDNIQSRDEDLLAFCNNLGGTRFLLSGRPVSLNLPCKFANEEVSSLNLDICLELFKKWYFNGTEPGKHLSLEDTEYAKEIIDLADCHTVTVELFAKLIRRQDIYETTLKGNKSPIAVFRERLIEYGFDLRFKDENGNDITDEPVGAGHNLLKKERRIIEQLAMLFSTMQLADESEKELLIKISTIPNLPFEFGEVKKWFSLKNKSLLEKLSEDGWLQRTYETEDSVAKYSMHSIIAAAIRYENAEVLHKTCQKFISSMGKQLLKRYSNREQGKLLIQFSWSIADVFGDDITKRDDSFFRALIEAYRKLHLDYEANILYRKLMQAPWYSITD